MAGTALIARPTGSVLPPELAEIAGLEVDAGRYAAAAKSAATIKAYESDWADFTGWCARFGLESLPAVPRTVILYVTGLAKAGKSVSTIARRAAAIASVHRAAVADNPCASEHVRNTLSGIRRTHGKPPDKKKALTVDLLTQVMRKIRGDARLAVRDRALILLCFGAALRRSELVAIRVEDLDFQRRGLMVTLPRSKTDQEGEGRKIAVPNGKLKIPAAVAAWIKAAGITDGYVFPAANRGQGALTHLSTPQFAKILKARCAAAGLDPDDFSGHSPRRGFATTAGDEGEDLRRTAKHMRHAKLETTLGYMEDGELFRSNAGQKFL